MRRVLLVITRLIVGGAQKLLLETACRLDKTRYEVLVAAGPETGAEGDLGASFDEALIPRVVVPHLVRAARPFTDRRGYLELKHLIRQWSPDLVHAHTSKAGLLGCTAARRLGVTAIIYSPHGHIFADQAAIEGVSDQPAWKRRLFLWLRRKAQAAADRVVALNERDRDEQVALGLSPRERYVVIPNGVDPDRWPSITPERRKEARGALDLEAATGVIAVVGRLVAEKNHDLLLSLLAGRLGDATLLVVGDGPLLGELQRRAQILGLSRRARFLGLRDDVSSVLDAADLLALPSRYESYGLVAVEAMAKGLPVVAFDVGGLREIVRDGETGVVVRAFDHAAFGDALLRLLGEEALRRRLGVAAREHVRARYSLDAMLRATSALYEALLAGREPPM